MTIEFVDSFTKRLSDATSEGSIFSKVVGVVKAIGRELGDLVILIISLIIQLLSFIVGYYRKIIG